jgi:hypothetical protein
VFSLVRVWVDFNSICVDFKSGLRVEKGGELKLGGHELFARVEGRRVDDVTLCMMMLHYV